MATNEATWSDKRTLSESADVTLRNSDDRTELIHHILEDIEEENLETLKNEKGKENAKNFDTDIEESQRVRKLTEKGEEEKIRRLKQRRTNALTAVSRKRTDMNKLMTDRRNLDVVKAELNQLDSLCQQFHDAHNLYYDELATPEEREIVSRYFNDKESNIFKCWILQCEARISDNLERLSDKRSAKSRSSRSSKVDFISSHLISSFIHLTLGRPKPSSKHAGSSAEAPLRSTNKVARKRSENETQRR